MLTRLLLVLALITPSLTNAAGTHAREFGFAPIVQSETPPTPPYNEWACGRVDDKSRGTAARMCRVIYDTPAAPEAYDTIFEYSRIESIEPALLIWVRIALDAESVRALYYRREHGEWIILDDRTFVRKVLPAGKDLQLFALDSAFGKEYQKLLCQFYEPNCPVWVPTFQFPVR